MLNLYDYKINYNNLLGSGNFGAVYEVVKRPEHEKNIFSWINPFLYDDLYRLDKKEYNSDLCVKIFHTAIQVGWMTDQVVHFYKSFYMPWSEKSYNQVLRKYNISKIDFHPTISFYAQIKTRVHGKNLYYYTSNDFFSKKDQFILRRSIVEFLSSIDNPNVYCRDFTTENIMYDEREHRFEAVDLMVEERTFEKSNIALFLEELEHYFSVKSRVILRRLIEIAQSREIYTEEMDNEILKSLL